MNIHTYNYFIYESLRLTRQKYLNTGKITEDELGILQKLDPTRTYKYLPMITSYYLDDVDLDIISKYVSSFDNLCSKNIIKDKDINKYKKINNLIKIVDEFSTHQTGKGLKRELSSNVEVLVDNKDLKVLKIKSYEEAKKYGANTKWCISGNDIKEWYLHNDGLMIQFYFIMVYNEDMMSIMYKEYKRFLDSEWTIRTDIYPSKVSNEDFYTPKSFNKIAISVSLDETIVVWNAIDVQIMNPYPLFEITNLPESLFKVKNVNEELNKAFKRKTAKGGLFISDYIDYGVLEENYRLENLGEIEEVNDRLALNSVNIKSLGKLRIVVGDLELNKSLIENLGDLKIVEGDVDLSETKNLYSTTPLKNVYGDLNLLNSNCKDLISLEEVSGRIIFNCDKSEYKISKELIKKLR